MELCTHYLSPSEQPRRVHLIILTLQRRTGKVTLAKYSELEKRPRERQRRLGMQIRPVLSPAGSKRVRPHSPRWGGGRGRGLEATPRVRTVRGCVHAHVAETPRGGPPLAACKRRRFPQLRGLRVDLEEPRSLLQSSSDSILKPREVKTEPGPLPRPPPGTLKTSETITLREIYFCLHMKFRFKKRHRQKAQAARDVLGE